MEAPQLEHLNYNMLPETQSSNALFYATKTHKYYIHTDGNRTELKNVLCFW